MVNLSDFSAGEPARSDFRRSNGAPLVRSIDGTRWERYSRPSGFGKDLDDESALVNWRIDRAIEGVATTPSLAASIAAHVGQKEGAAERRDRAISIGRGEEAADLGTALHAIAARVESDPGFRVPPPYDADVAAYLLAMSAAGLDTSYIEVSLCSDIWRAAGTADRIFHCRRDLALPSGEQITAGTSIIADLKTGAKLTYSVPGYAIQLAVYCDSVFYDVATDVRSPLPGDLHTGWGLIIHLPVGEARCDLHWVDLDVGRVGAALVNQVRAWRKRKDFLVPFTMPPSDEVAVLDSPIYNLEAGLDPPPNDDDQWLGAMLPWAQERINTIGTHPEARALLLRRWPADVPPLRAGGVSPAGLARVLDLIDTVESAFSIPFPPGDPRQGWSEGLHRSQVQRTNEPPTQEQAT